MLAFTAVVIAEIVARGRVSRATGAALATVYLPVVGLITLI